MRELDRFLSAAEEIYADYLNEGDEDCFLAMVIPVETVFEDWIHEGEKVEVWGFANDFDNTPLIYIKHTKDGHDSEDFHLWELELRSYKGFGEPFGHREPMFKWHVEKVYSPEWDSLIDGAVEDYIWEKSPVILL